MDIISSQVQQFILDHEHDDERDLILRHKEILGVPASRIAEQISGRRKAKEKLPTYYTTAGIVYPPGVNLEQSSSEPAAKYKSELIQKTILRGKPGKEMVDLTGGFGVDSFFFSKVFDRVHYVEPDSDLLEIARNNHQQLGVANITYHCASAEQFLSQLDHRVDVLYIDPSRRKDGDKVFSLSDSEPDILQLQTKILEKTNHFVIKTSPLLDLSVGLEELSFVKSVFVVAVNNECKEVLFFCKKSFNEEPVIEAVNLREEGSSGSLTFLLEEERKAEVEFRDPLTYLYEPNVAILKAGAFKSVAVRYTVYKVHPSTHLYTSERLIQNFPGRVFKIQAIVKPDPKDLDEFFPGGKANVITRNYPLSAEELKKKTKLKDGGEKYLLAFSGLKEKFVLAAERIK